MSTLDMSPAANTKSQAEHDKEILALSKGFAALLETAHKLTHQERGLQSRLQLAYDEYLKLANQLPGASDEIKASETIFHDSTHNNNGNGNGTIDNLKWISDVEEAGYISTSAAKDIAEGWKVSEAVLHRFGPSDSDQALNACPLAVHAERRGVIERDFTTNGVQGELHCPFAKTEGDTSDAGQQANGDIEICGNDNRDPIKAELHHDQPAPGLDSPLDVPPQCPIRFLDNNSPEAVAQYFEKHKHEIPHSHSVCIRRYQKNAHHVHQLDQKYGNVVNMVKGLGEYHQPYLSNPLDPDEAPGTKSTSVGRVEKWAEDVSNKSPQPNGDVHAGEVEVEPETVDGREGRFERSLRDIRVGESPSRPWGIHVPLTQNPRGVLASPTIPDAAPQASNWSQYDGKPTAPPFSVSMPTAEGANLIPKDGRCPFGNRPSTTTNKVNTIGAPKAPTAENADMRTGSPEHYHPSPSFNPRSHVSSAPPVPSQETSQPKMVFNGPVFFGYSAEAASVLLEKLGTHGTG